MHFYPVPHQSLRFAAAGGLPSSSSTHSHGFLCGACSWMNQYISSISKHTLHFSTFTSFFYPSIHIVFTHAQQSTHPTAAYPGVVCFDGLLAHFFRVRAAFGIQRVCVTAFIAFASLCARAILSIVCLVFLALTLRATTALDLFCFSHFSIVPFSTPLGYSLYAIAKMLK